MPRRKGAPEPETNFLASSLAPAAVVGAGLALATAAAGGLFGQDQLPVPFVWTDVALVQFLCSLPLATTIAALTRARGGPALCWILFIAGLVATTALWAIAAPRWAIGLCAATGVMLLVVPWLRASPHATAPAGNWASISVLGLAVLIGLPRIYLEARSNHDNGQLSELLSQSRLGEAAALARQMLAIDSDRSFRDQPLRNLSADLDRTVRAMESRVAAPLLPMASDEAHLSRARELAMLGRTRQALDEIDRSASVGDSPDGHLLRGTIHQTRQEWLSSAEAFRRAAMAIESLPASEERTAGLVTAATGVAFAERKLGHNALAEAAYQQVLELDPSADSHYLLAQFYEGTQQAAKAQFHARQAMALAPDRYDQAGQRLIDKLITHHFGCWGAASAQGKD